MITTNCVTVAFLYKALEDGDAKLALQLFKGLGVRMPIFRGGGRMPTGSIGTAEDAIRGEVGSAGGASASAPPLFGPAARGGDVVTPSVVFPGEGDLFRGNLPPNPRRASPRRKTGRGNAYPHAAGESLTLPWGVEAAFSIGARRMANRTLNSEF